MADIEIDRITVLIVDDSPDSLSMLNTALNQAGITVLVALGGRQAIAIIEKIEPDIVLLDALMPDLDGFQTCERIKRLRPHIPIVFMTGLTQTADIVRGLEAGAVDYVTKPVNTDEVLARLKVHTHNAKNLIGAKAALDSAGQSIIAIDTMGVVQWATSRARDLLDKYNDDTYKLSAELADALNRWLSDTPKASLQLGNFLSTAEETVTADYVNKLGSFYLVRLTCNSPAKEVIKDEKDNISLLCAQLPVTNREASVLYWVSKGKSNWEIATILAIKPRTISKHLEQIYKKLEVSNRTAAAAMALQLLADTAE